MLFSFASRDIPVDSPQWIRSILPPTEPYSHFRRTSFNSDLTQNFFLVFNEFYILQFPLNDFTMSSYTTIPLGPFSIVPELTIIVESTSHPLSNLSVNPL